MNHRRIAISVVLLFIPLLLSCGSRESVDSLSKIGWYAYDTGIEQAEASKKKIFLYFRADW